MTGVKHKLVEAVIQDLTVVDYRQRESRQEAAAVWPTPWLRHWRRGIRKLAIAVSQVLIVHICVTMEYC